MRIRRTQVALLWLTMLSCAPHASTGQVAMPEGYVFSARIASLPAGVGNRQALQSSAPRSGGSSRKKRILMGAIVGAVVGYVPSRWCDGGNCVSQNIKGVLLGAALGGIIGGAMGRP